MTDDRKLDLEPGLYFDEAVRTLPEVTLRISAWVEELGIELDSEMATILDQGIVEDSHTGLLRWSENVDPELGDDIYRELTDIVTEHLPEGLWFGYLNEGGGWGVWEDEEDC